MNWKWEIAKADHIGGRDEQQDKVAVFSAPNGETHLLVVADGMGGHKGGYFASQLVIKSAQLLWDKYQQGRVVTTPQKFLQRICELAHQKINQFGKKYQLSPGSTCILLYIKGKQAWWAHIGDSRLYYFRHKKLRHRTRDHSVVQLLADLGHITEEEMATHPDQGCLLRGLGGDEPAKPEFGQAQLRAGDSFVLCSDGFWEHVSAPKMRDRLLQKHFPVKKRVKQLLKDALDAGGAEGDNIAVAVAQVQSKTLFNKIVSMVLGLIVIALLGGNVSMVPLQMAYAGTGTGTELGR
ncbi:MAG: serine/threonine-protein phosphatase [Candidatus Parabeggiatoa sp. nov. 1]|nr:MAG: serine/threonine-protein phosphatase [Gammaproteobacteria bacterium]